MALMNSHETPFWPHRRWAGLAAPGSRFWATGAAFIAIYFALNLLTEWHEFDRLGITLWSPDDGLSLALLLANVAFAPFVFLAAVLVDLSIAEIHRSIGMTLMAELCLTMAYVGLAFVLKNALRFDIRQFRLPDVVAFLVLVPAGAALSAFIYCGVLYLGGELSSDKVFVAMIHCWIGSALGIVTVIPATTAVFTYALRPWRWSGYTFFTVVIFLLGIGLGFAALVGVGDKLYYLFNLLFLPVIWVAMREGYAGVALALVTIQLTLAVLTAFVGYSTTDFAILQLLMLVLSITGLLLGAVTTERQDAALRLREQKREMARMVSNARAGAMGMALAHEVSQPLSTVTTYLHAARRLLQTSVTSAPVMDALVKAEAEAQRAREVLERIRDFVSNGNLNLTPLDMSALAEKIGELCREEAAARGVLVEVENMGLVPLVEADGVQIEQVLINLVANAVDSAADRPDARGRVIMGVAAKADAIMLRVEDNGAGVPPELADNIFDAYQTTKPRGMGLGLHLSRRIVQRHAGRLWSEPVATGGARFIVELPINGSAHNVA
ncbi:MAG: MASE1 domain-containing protein [Hyphomicrobiales bacterium]|nr:MASE1 domain-containing protein [Hyphomicrobiales bacterium]MBV9910705.1 MASE1 domain-containing protein [Hyphomicrobiales bacterium]